jgi:hypothetical protein
MTQPPTLAWFPQFQAGHQWLINQNPITLTFYRRRRTRNGTHFDAQPIEDLGAHVVRVHQRGSGSAQVSDRNAGWQERDTTWGMIAGADLPVNVTDGEDGDIRVDFVHPVHGWFRLRRLRAVEGGGVLIGWQSDLERIAGQWQLEPDIDPPAAGRPSLEDDPEWVATMTAMTEFMASHPGIAPRGALRALGYQLPSERSLQRWVARWKQVQAATPPQTT